MTKRLSSIESEVRIKDEYDYEDHLNWRDDGSVFIHPSVTDYLKGFNMDPYQFTQWAVKNNKNTKTSAKETIVMDFGAEYLANNILTRWNGSDGPLQDYFNAYTHRYNNDLKIAISDILNAKGYDVLPILYDETNRHASVLKNVISSKNVLAKLKYISSLNLKSKCFKQFMELIDSMSDKEKLTVAEVNELLDYYSHIYPRDYAIHLTQKIFNPPAGTDTLFERFKDFSISDESLNKIEDYMSGNADPYGANYDGGISGYNFISDTRGFDGVSPNEYTQVRMSKKKN